MTSPAARAAARMRAFCLIAESFTHPKAGSSVYADFDSFSRQLTDATEILFGVAAPISHRLEDFETLEADYIDLFLVGAKGRPVIFMHAGEYPELLDGQPRSEFMHRFACWYKFFGVRTRRDDHANELPDHIVCQFEFLALLASLQYESIGDSTLATGYARAQRDFIERETLPFLELFTPRLARQSERRGSSTMFASLAQAALQLLTRTVHEFNSQFPPVHIASDAGVGLSSSSVEEIAPQSFGLWD